MDDVLFPNLFDILSNLKLYFFPS